MFHGGWAAAAQAAKAVPGTDRTPEITKFSEHLVHATLLASATANAKIEIRGVQPTQPQHSTFC